MSDPNGNSPSPPGGPRRANVGVPAAPAYAQKVENQLAGLRGDISERDARIAALEAGTVERDKRISQLEEALSSARSEASNREAKIAELARQRLETINELEGRIAQERLDNAATAEELDAKRGLLQQTQAKLTGVIRTRRRIVGLGALALGGLAFAYHMQVTDLRQNLVARDGQIKTLSAKLEPFLTVDNYAKKLVSDAKEKADAIVFEAESEVSGIKSSARAEVSQIESERDSISGDLARLKTVSRRELSLDNAIPAIISNYPQLKIVLRNYVEKWGVSKSWSDETISCIRSAIINKADDYIADGRKSGFDSFKDTFETSAEACISDDSVEKEFIDTFFYIENNTFDRIKAASAF